MSAAKAAAATLVDPNEAASPLDADASWVIVIVYDDAPAGKHAIHTLEGVRHQLGGRIALHPSLWRFDLLEDPDWRAAATAEAVQAGLAIISTSSKGDLPAAVRDLVHGCLQAGTSAPGALVALLGPAGAMDTSDSPRIQFLRNAAEAAGFSFFAPTPHTARPPLPAAPFPSPPLEERRSSFSASTPDLLVGQPAGTPPQTAASRMVTGLLSPTLSSKGGEGEPKASCSGPPDAWNVQARPSLAASASPAPARPAHRILLVEDDSTILQFSVLVLVHAGYQVRAVEGTQAAWEALQSRSYDLLITDNQMPGLSGLELVSKLRSAQLALPVVVASGGIDAEELAQNQRLQPALALPKPFTADQLLETVAEALRRAGRDPAHTQVSFPAYGDSYSHWGLNE